MFKALFNIIINLVASLIQIVVWPINQLIIATLPDLSSKLLFVSTQLNSIFDNLTWALGLVPPIIIETLLFIIAVEIAKHTIYISTHALVKAWNVLQKIKFW